MSRITWNTRLRHFSFPVSGAPGTAKAVLAALILCSSAASNAQQPPAEPPAEQPAETPEAPSSGAQPETAPAAPAPAEPAEAPAPAEPAEAPAAEAPVAEPIAEPAAAPEALGTAPLLPPPAAEPQAPAVGTPATAQLPPPIAVPSTALLPPPPPPEDDLPIPTLTIDRIPPNTSYEFALQVSYGTVAYFRESVAPWIGFGLRGGWGKNFGVNRLGVAGTFAAEGDVGVHTQLSIEPAVAWDVVAKPGFLLGASAGPAIVWTAENSTVEAKYSLAMAPSLAARIGWSQTWSRVGRRLFVFAEPKVRFARGQASPLIAVAVGSGGGR